MGWFYFICAMAALVAVALIITLGKLTRSTSVQGRLISEQGEAAVVAPSTGGTITKILVAEGQGVAKGDPLLYVSDSQSSVALGNTADVVTGELEKKSAEIRLLISARQERARANQSELEERLGLLRSRKEHLAKQASTHEQRYRLANEIYRRWSEHAAAVVSGYQISRQHDEALQLQAQLDAIQDQRLQLEAEIAETTAALRMLPTDLLKDVAELKMLLSDVTQQIADAERSRGLVLRATQDGRVSTVLVKEGQFAEPSKLLLTVVPTEQRLMAEFWVPGSLVAQLRKGATVDLRYDALLEGGSGWAPGKVHELGAVSLSPAELTSVLGTEQKNAGYRLTVELPSQSLDVGLGRAVQLKPGMPLTARISLHSRGLRELLFKPTSSGRGREGTTNG